MQCVFHVQCMCVRVLVSVFTNRALTRQESSGTTFRDDPELSHLHRVFVNTGSTNGCAAVKCILQTSPRPRLCLGPCGDSQCAVFTLSNVNSCYFPVLQSLVLTEKMYIDNRGKVCAFLSRPPGRLHQRSIIIHRCRKEKSVDLTDVNSFQY